MANLKLERTIEAPLSKKILEEMQNGIGFIPNMYAKMGHNAALLDAYRYTYERFRNDEQLCQPQYTSGGGQGFCGARVAGPYRPRLI